MVELANIKESSFWNSF